MPETPDTILYRDGAAILRDRLPDLLTRKGYRTSSSAWHADNFTGELTEWKLKDQVKNDGLSNQKNCLDNEHYLCGDEQSVCGRFAQNALAPVGAVALNNHIPYLFGDCKACFEGQQRENKQEIPDFIAAYCPSGDAQHLGNLPKTMDSPGLVLVGEAKTPWNHNIRQAWMDYANEDDKDEYWIRKALGQIARYMHHFKMKYGFLTTYNYTIFLQQDMLDDKAPVLSFTPPISHKTSGSGTNDVSLRQYLYFLLGVIENTGDYKFDNPLPLEDWVSTESQKPVAGAERTPNTRILDPSPRVRPMTPDNTRQSNKTSILTLHDCGSEFRATIDLPRRIVDQWYSDYGTIAVSDTIVRVTIITSDRELAYIEEGSKGSKGRTVTFDTSHGDEPSKNLIKGKTSSSLSFQQQREAFSPEESLSQPTQPHRGVTPSPPTQEESSSYQGPATSRLPRDVFLQSPTPLPGSSRGRGDTTVPSRQGSPPDQSSSRPQHGESVLPSGRPHQSSERTDTSLVHRPKDGEKKKSQSSKSGSSSGMTLRSSNKPSDKSSGKSSSRK